jgi:hypothetical protein
MSFSFNCIGNLGHLGNQMFQYAFVKGMSVKHSRSFFISPPEIFGKHYNLKLLSSIDQCFDIRCERKVTNYPILNERFFHFDEEFFENPPTKDVDFFGYFQTEKYFKHIEKELREDFTFKKDIYETSLEFFESIDNDPIALHIRRGDYVSNPNHPVQSFEYYTEALNHFDGDLPVLIFSDDPEWCKNQEIFYSDRFLVSETYDTGIDLCLMSLCKYHIIANSSFSWWGSWLAKSEKTIAPKNWFGGDCSRNNTKDLYLPSWEVI